MQSQGDKSFESGESSPTTPIGLESEEHYVTPVHSVYKPPDTETAQKEETGDKTPSPNKIAEPTEVKDEPKDDESNQDKKEPDEPTKGNNQDKKEPTKDTIEPSKDSKDDAVSNELPPEPAKVTDSAKPEEPADQVVKSDKTTPVHSVYTLPELDDRIQVHSVYNHPQQDDVTTVPMPKLFERNIALESDLITPAPIESSTAFDAVPSSLLEAAPIYSVDQESEIEVGSNYLEVEKKTVGCDDLKAEIQMVRPYVGWMTRKSLTEEACHSSVVAMAADSQVIGYARKRGSLY